MDNVRAKFRVYSIEETPHGKRISLSPVTSGSEENDKFFAATPGGSIRLEVVNKTAADAFELDKQYYVDFSPAE